ncbi:2'-5' RNA ligase family protein [Patescibacteria group bacterium]|nr:2'-5' RNA ligase family protein [Patescibacteria group bacterium]
MSNKRYAVWYEPVGDVYTELKNIIIDLSKKYNSPVFEPHITLLPGGSSLNKEIVVEKLTKVVNEVKPFVTTFRQLNHSDEFFKSVHIELEENDALMEFAGNIQHEINGEIAKNFVPHLSILYGKFLKEEREKIIKLIGENYNKSFILNKVDVIEYEFNQPPETWKKVSSIEVKKVLN